jgi:hypothetical protein
LALTVVAHAHKHGFAIMESPSSSDRRSLYVATALVLLVLALFVPLLAIGSFVLALFGGCCARSAVVHRGEGWRAGLILGIILALAGGAGIIGVLSAWLLRN